MLEREAFCDRGEGGWCYLLLVFLSQYGHAEGGERVDLLSTGSTAFDISQTGEVDICLPEEIFCANKLKYPDRSSTALGFTALTLSSG